MRLLVGANCFSFSQLQQDIDITVSLCSFAKFNAFPEEVFRRFPGWEVVFFPVTGCGNFVICHIDLPGRYILQQSRLRIDY